MTGWMIRTVVDIRYRDYSNTVVIVLAVREVFPVTVNQQLSHRSRLKTQGGMMREEKIKPPHCETG